MTNRDNRALLEEASWVSPEYRRFGAAGFARPFRITSGHPLLPHHIEDADGNTIAGDGDLWRLTAFQQKIQEPGK